MIENLQDQLGNKQGKGSNVCVNIGWELEVKKCSKHFFKVIERRNLQNQTISELCTDDNKSKYPSNPKDIFKSAKEFYENLYIKETTPKAAPTKLLSKIPSRKKISNDQFNLSRAKISLDEIIKSIKSQTNNKSLGNNALTAKFYKHFSNELDPVLLDVYDS